MMKLIVQGKQMEYTREVPPDFIAKPYWSLMVQCPHCGIQFSIIEASIKPGQILECGNMDCLKEMIADFDHTPVEDDQWLKQAGTGAEEAAQVTMNAGVPIFKYRVNRQD